MCRHVDHNMTNREWFDKEPDSCGILICKYIFSLICCCFPCWGISADIEETRRRTSFPLTDRPSYSSLAASSFSKNEIVPLRKERYTYIPSSGQLPGTNVGSRYR